MITNEEIKTQLQEYENQLAQCDMATFEIHSQVNEIKNKMNELRKQCTHKDSFSKFTISNDGRCVYCKQLLTLGSDN